MQERPSRVAEPYVSQRERGLPIPHTHGQGGPCQPLGRKRRFRGHPQTLDRRGPCPVGGSAGAVRPDNHGWPGDPGTEEGKHNRQSVRPVGSGGHVRGLRLGIPSPVRHRVWARWTLVRDQQRARHPRLSTDRQRRAGRHVGGHTRQLGWLARSVWWLRARQPRPAATGSDAAAVDLHSRESTSAGHAAVPAL